LPKIVYIIIIRGNKIKNPTIIFNINESNKLIIVTTVDGSNIRKVIPVKVQTVYTSLQRNDSYYKTMNIGDTVTLDFIATPSDASETIFYITSDSNVATVDENGVVKKVIQLSHNIENKYEYLTFLENQYNISGNKIFFMGNADNDESAHGAGVKTLCVNPDKTNPYDKNYWDYYIEDIQNLQEILPFIE